MKILLWQCKNNCKSLQPWNNNRLIEPAAKIYITFKNDIWKFNNASTKRPSLVTDKFSRHGYTLSHAKIKYLHDTELPWSFSLSQPALLTEFTRFCLLPCKQPNQKAPFCVVFFKRPSQRYLSSSRSLFPSQSDDTFCSGRLTEQVGMTWGNLELKLKSGICCCCTSKQTCVMTQLARGSGACDVRAATLWAACRWSVT